MGLIGLDDLNSLICIGGFQPFQPIQPFQPLPSRLAVEEAHFPHFPGGGAGDEAVPEVCVVQGNISIVPPSYGDEVGGPLHDHHYAPEVVEGQESQPPEADAAPVRTSSAQSDIAVINARKLRTRLSVIFLPPNCNKASVDHWRSFVLNIQYILFAVYKKYP